MVLATVQYFPQFIMQSHRAILSLKGTNINLPNRYKIRKYKAGKAKSEKPQQIQQIEEGLPFILEAKETFPLRRLLQIPRNMISHSQDKTTQISELQSNLCNPKPKQLTTTTPNKTQCIISVSNSKLMDNKQQKMALLKRNRDHYSSMKSKRCICGDCAECMKDFAYFLHLFSDDQSVPQISAKSWCIWKKKNGKFLHYYGKRIHKVREIASLTKMITAMTVIDFLNKYQLNPEHIKYEIRKTSTLVGGTTANLKQGQICTLLQLIYGMMLPSGNDAAIALSQVIGLLYFLKNKNKPLNPQTEKWYEPYINKNYAYLFIGMMNDKCLKIGTLDTKFFNSHGNDSYDQLKNISTCNQVAKIASQFMNYPLLREIVRTPQYGPYQNTNKLLEDGFDGIKTGITDSAGPCLAASYKQFIIVVLNSKSMNERWIQVKKLVKWIIKKI